MSFTLSATSSANMLYSDRFDVPTTPSTRASQQYSLASSPVTSLSAQKGYNATHEGFLRGGDAHNRFASPVKFSGPRSTGETDSQNTPSRHNASNYNPGAAMRSTPVLPYSTSSSTSGPSRQLTTSVRSASVSKQAVQRRDSLPPVEKPSYQGLAFSNLPSNAIRRPPRKKAVIVGVNYVLTPDIILRGSCNDATAFALTLINLCGFDPQSMILLIDAFPADCYRLQKGKENEEPGKVVPHKHIQPTRQNILLALNWLRSDTIPGDVLIFYFSGHGVQVDDMSGWEGEGYDEAILPVDFYGNNINAITAVMIRNVLLNVFNDVQVTAILDCNGGQTMLDPSGTGKWNFIKGVKQRGVWPFVTDATDKVSRATYDPTAWTDKAMKKRGARPRFVPGVDVSSTQELLDPTLQKPSVPVPQKVKGYLFAAAPWSQSAIEVKMEAIRLTVIDYANSVYRDEGLQKCSAYHGVFTWCFINALQDLMTQAVIQKQMRAVSYNRLIAEVERRIKALKSPKGGLPKLNQIPELTFYQAGGSDPRDYFTWPFGGRRQNVEYLDLYTSQNELPCIPTEQEYLSVWEAEEQLRRAGETRRKNDPALLARSNTLSKISLSGESENPVYERSATVSKPFSPKREFNHPLMYDRSSSSATEPEKMTPQNAEPAQAAPYTPPRPTPLMYSNPVFGESHWAKEKPVLEITTEPKFPREAMTYDMVKPEMISKVNVQPHSSLPKVAPGTYATRPYAPKSFVKETVRVYTQPQPMMTRNIMSASSSYIAGLAPGVSSQPKQAPPPRLAQYQQTYIPEKKFVSTGDFDPIQSSTTASSLSSYVSSGGSQYRNVKVTRPVPKSSGLEIRRRVIAPTTPMH